MPLSADVVSRIDRLELAARQVVEGYLAGRHKSPRHGFAVEFAQHREYAPGDDIKHIDWKVFARTERYHLKQYEQETNLVAWLVVDASGSMRVSTHARPDGSPVTKYDVAGVLAAALAYLITQQADLVGLATFADRPRVTLKPSGAPGQFREVLRWLGEAPSDQPAATGPALQELSAVCGRRGVVFVFSDLLDDASALAAGLRGFQAHKHDVVLFQILDPAEVDFPFRHPTLFRGLEGLADVSTDPQTVRDSYLAALAEHQAALDEVCRTHAVDLVRVRTDADLGAALAGYLRKRAAR